MYYIKQLTNDDCGFACLKMLLAKINKCKNYIYLKQELNHGAYSYQNLIDIAKEYKLNLKGYKYSNLDELKYDLKAWCLVSIYNENSKHCVIIKKITNRQVYIIDPYLGVYELNRNEFERIWDKTALIVDDFLINKIEKIKFKITNKALVVFSIILLSLSLISSFLGINYINENVHYFIPIILFCSFFIFEISYRYCNIQIMKNMDKSILNDKRYDKEKSIDTKQIYEAFSKYKQNLLTLINNVFKSFIISIFLIVVGILNNPNHFLFVIGILVVSILDIAILRPCFKKLERKISLKEQQELSINKLSNLNIINKMSYKYANMYMLKNITVIAIIIMGVLLDMFANDIYSLAYLIMYSVWYYTLYKSFTYMFNLKSYFDELNVYKCLLTNSLIRKTTK